MNFYLAAYSDFQRIPINCLCVSTTNEIPVFFKGINTVDCTNGGIFNTINNFSEDEYFNSVNIAMRKAGHNGFMEYIKKVSNDLSNYNYHDKNDKIIIFDSVAFLSNDINDNHLKCIEKLFINFGFEMKRFRNGKNSYNSLF